MADHASTADLYPPGVSPPASIPGADCQSLAPAVPRVPVGPSMPEDAGESPSPPAHETPPAVGVVEGESRSGWLGNSASFLTSMVVHLGALIALALFPLSENPLERVVFQEDDPIVVQMPADSSDSGEVVADQLIEQMQASQITAAAFSEDPLVGRDGSANGRLIDRPALDANVLANDWEGGPTSIDRPLDLLIDRPQIESGVPEGTLGDPRRVVGNYEEALDRITEEVLWMLARGKVVLVWAFDQSESMKDDQAEIRGRIDHVYGELGAKEASSGDALASSVVSFGQGYMVHTHRGPTSDVEEFKRAIDEVPSDPSGKEMLCPAVIKSIQVHASYAGAEERQMALIVVTDESGDPATNAELLEQAVQTAKDHDCRIYVLGRESVFGYPFAQMSWVHPQTGREHWLPVDRGPETAFPEQLQTDGFRQRSDAHPSGFGPYEQARLARESGGIFFMLPTTEVRLVRDGDYVYDMDALRLYRPDLRSRESVIGDRDGSHLRRILWKIIGELDPARQEVAEILEVRFRFSHKSFAEQVLQEQAKAARYVNYLAAAAEALEELRWYRDQEASLRWQANYDLIYAQVIAYLARRYEYGAYLANFPRSADADVPVTRPGYMALSSWNLAPGGATMAGADSQAYIDRSTSMFRQIIEDHPGTPWAARAEWELQRGYGWRLQPRYSYYGPRPTQTAGGAQGGAVIRPRPQQPAIPIPNL